MGIWTYDTRYDQERSCPETVVIFSASEKSERNRPPAWEFFSHQYISDLSLWMENRESSPGVNSHRCGKPMVSHSDSDLEMVGFPHSSYLEGNSRWLLQGEELGVFDLLLPPIHGHFHRCNFIWFKPPSSLWFIILVTTVVDGAYNPNRAISVGPPHILGIVC